MSNGMRHLFSVTPFGIYKCGIITSTGYIAFVEKMVSFNFLRVTSKDRKQLTEMGNYLVDILKLTF